MKKRHKHAPLYAAIGHNIQLWRKARNLEQKQVAEEIGMTQSAYSRLESGETQIRVDQLIQLAQVFNVSARKLLGSLLD